MIHTFELQKQITFFDSIKINRRYKFYLVKKKIGYTFRVYKGLQDRGINEVTILTIPSNTYIGTDFYIKFVINPSVVLAPQNDIRKTDDIRNYPTGTNCFNDDVIFSIYNYIYSYFPELNEHSKMLDEIYEIEDIDKYEKGIKEWKQANYNSFNLNRIDYTYDISLCPKEYLTLLNRGYRSKRGKDRKFFHQEGEQNIDIKNKSIEIKAYDKERQLIESGFSEIAGKHEVLRIETSFFKGKMYDVRNKSQEKIERNLFDFADEKIGYEYTIKKLNEITGEGDYVEYDTAIQIIDDSSYSSNIKKKLKKHILEISKHRGIEKYLDKVRRQSGSKEATVKKHLKMIHSLGINPVTLSKKGFVNVPTVDGKKALPSISTIIKAYYDVESHARTEESLYEDVDKWVKTIEEYEAKSEM